MIGQFATSKAGHDKNMLYVVVAEEGEFVALCDGQRKTIAAPKKKRRKHIQPIGQTVDQKTLEAIQNKTVRDERIKYAIRHYAAQ